MEWMKANGNASTSANDGASTSTNDGASTSTTGDDDDRASPPNTACRVTRSQTRKRNPPTTLKGRTSGQPRTKMPRRSDASTESSRLTDENETLSDDSGVTETSSDDSSPTTQQRTKCSKCLQCDDNIQSFSGDPADAISECALFELEDLFLEDSGCDDKPSVKIAEIVVYDDKCHMCQLDTGLLEKGRHLYISGYVKGILADDPTAKDGIATTRIGPIESWWSWGFDGGSSALLGVTTDLLNYFVLSAAEEYQPFMVSKYKINLGKHVIEFLQDHPEDTFEEMRDYLMAIDPVYNEEFVLLHAPYIVAQLVSYDREADPDELILLSTRAARRLQELAGVEGPKETKRIAATLGKAHLKKVLRKNTLATTTAFVCGLLSSFFGDQMDASNSTRKNCRNCDPCRRAPCKNCKGCRSTAKLCNLKKCENPVNKDIVMDEDSDEEGVEDEMDLKVKSNQKDAQRRILLSEQKASKVVWKGDPLKVVTGVKYYSKVSVDDSIIIIGDCLMFQPGRDDEQLYLGKVQYMYEEKQEKMLHVSWFWRGSDTILGDVAKPYQVYMTNECDSVPAGSVIGKCNVECGKPSDKLKAASCDLNGFAANGDDSFFCVKFYHHNTARFEDIPEDVVCEDNKQLFKFCTSCYRRNDLAQFNTPVLGKQVPNLDIHEYSSFRLFGHKFRVGECVFMNPKACSTLASQQFVSARARHTPDLDPETYPERYRKTNDVVCGGNLNVPDPFLIGRILSITQTRNIGYVRVAIFFRPENTHRAEAACHDTDFNMLYWSEKEITVPLSMVMGKCVVAYCNNITNLESFRGEGPHRFYFKESYNRKRKRFEEVPNEAKFYSGKGKGKTYADYPSLKKKLKAMDVFCGCGGLSHGFHLAEVAETVWAIENSPAAAEAFEINNPKCTVFEEDCNEFLKMVMDGTTCDSRGRPLPKKGEVDLIMGGPPCQGFSGMNRFNTREYSKFTNSLIATYLSMTDFFRPRFFVLENVRNFVSYKGNMVLKLVLNCLVEMGYQVAFAIVQAGNYGVPQTRRRMIIWAAAPGEKLPKFPEPQHVFSSKGGQLSVSIDDTKITSNIRWTDSAPYRCVTVSDALNDLPEIKSGASAHRMAYDRPAVSPFQKMMRDNGNILKDHVTKPMNELTVERFRHIPLLPGADWRDLPNKEVHRNGRTIAYKLEYTHVLGDSTKRGVCSCRESKAPCDPACRQSNTLIPWCLPHTGYRHNQWTGLFGRLSLDGYFCTTITNPEPMGKQGCVIHPSQHRVVSVRECARSQGFTDSYSFFGKILDRYRQIGNAVPPLLARALAMELRKCVADSRDT